MNENPPYFLAKLFKSQKTPLIDQCAQQTRLGPTMTPLGGVRHARPARPVTALLPYPYRLLNLFNRPYL